MIWRVGIPVTKWNGYFAKAEAVRWCSWRRLLWWLKLYLILSTVLRVVDSFMLYVLFFTISSSFWFFTVSIFSDLVPACTKILHYSIDLRSCHWKVNEKIFVVWGRNQSFRLLRRALPLLSQNIVCGSDLSPAEYLSILSCLSGCQYVLRHLRSRHRATYDYQTIASSHSLPQRRRCHIQVHRKVPKSPEFYCWYQYPTVLLFFLLFSYSVIVQVRATNKPQK